MSWFAEAPANIALIKYMGKKDPLLNIPSNSSLSYTLDDLNSFVELEISPTGEDYWESLTIPGTKMFDLDEQGQARYFKHLNYLKEQFNYEGTFALRSTNNFPSHAGLASSASSFAALTKATLRALCELTHRDEADNDEMARLSRIGSGSSIRSFYSPWALWTDKTVTTPSIPYDNLIHHVIVVSHEKKKVLSSEAHERVKTSPHFATRVERAESRLKALMDAFTSKDWKSAYTICWEEFWDMHQLFETASEPFSYMSEDSKSVLYHIENYWKEHNDGPLVTMDAGPNVHLLFRKDQVEMAKGITQIFVGNYDVL